MPCLQGRPRGDREDLRCGGGGRAHHIAVSSALEGIALTAAVSRVVADAGISCNVIAGAAHDHPFVDWLGDIALALIRQP